MNGLNMNYLTIYLVKYGEGNIGDKSKNGLFEIFGK